MAEKVCAFTVVMEQNIGKDEADSIANAIKMLKGVLSVETHVADSLNESVAGTRIRKSLVKKLYDVLK
jgi:hypothetical protein